MSEDWDNTEIKPPIGTKLHWQNGSGGWVRHHWGVVVKHTKATIAIQMSPVNIIQSSGDGSYSSETLEPTWNMQNGISVTITGKFIRSWGCWCVGKDRSQAKVETYKEGTVGFNCSYY